MKHFGDNNAKTLKSNYRCNSSTAVVCSPEKIDNILISDSVVAVPTKAKDVKKPEVKPNPPGAKIWKIKKE